MAGSINWWTIDNGVENLMINGSLKHTLKQVKTVKKRTRVLNVELKKFSALTSYKKYVDIKTEVLRNITDSEESDDEISDDNAPEDEEDNEIDESHHDNVPGSKNKNTKNEIEENGHNEEENFEENDRNEVENFEENESNEEELKDNKYEENENYEEEYYGDEKYEDDEYYDEKYEAGEYYQDENFVEENYEDDEDYEENYEEGKYEETEKYEEEFEKIDESEKYEEKSEKIDKSEKYEEKSEKIDENEKYEEKSEKIDESEKYEEKSEIIDETIDDIENSDKTLTSPKTIDEGQKKPQPIITCTEILKSKYTIIRSNGENDKTLIEYAEDEHNPENCEEVNEVINVEKTSPETYRVSQLKRINLLYDSNDSDDSDSSLDERNKILPELKRRKSLKERIAATSQVISDPSDSDEWYTKNTPGKISSSNNEKITKHPSASSLYISDSDNDDIVNSTENKIVTPKTKKVIKKSLKSQIYDQESNDGNNEAINKNYKNSINNTEPTEAESLQYVLRNILSHNNNQDTLDSELNTSTPVQQEVLPRPVELDEFIEREGLIHTEELSTIDLDEIRKSNDEDDDEDIWLMEIPKCIISDQLCGKEIVLAKKRMKIDDTCYETISRKDKLVSCILSAGDKPKYKAVNVSLVRSIVVRQESSEASCIPLGQSSTASKTKNGNLVPFPSHIKARNPLMVSNDEDKRKKRNSSTKNDSFTESKEVKKKAENISPESSENEFEKKSKKIHSPSKILDTPKIPPQTIRRSTGGTKKKKKTPVWRRNNFLLSSKKNKDIQKKL